MKNTRKGAWQSKRGPTPAIPAYKPPRQTRSSRKADKIVVVESEAKSDSEDDTCFGVVWEKKGEAVKTPLENPYPKGIKSMSAREADECAEFGEVLRWSTDSEGETDKTTRADKDKPKTIEYEGEPWKDMRNTIVLITETEAETEERQQASVTDANETQATVIDKAITDTVVERVKVAKQFEAGLFIGEITAVNTKRGRSLYTVLYEDGDGEDMNDREYKEARELYEETKGLGSMKSVTQTEVEETEDEPLHSGGETEGSDFLPSDDELKKIWAKKRRKILRSPQKEKEKPKRGKKSKEVETRVRKRKNAVIDVDAILKLGSKDNITNKTVALMTPEEASVLSTTTGKSILKEAKKGLRVQAFKVHFIFVIQLNFLIISTCCRNRQNTQH